MNAWAQCLTIEMGLVGCIGLEKLIDDAKTLHLALAEQFEDCIAQLDRRKKK